MERLSDATAAAIVASVERAQIVPPPGLAGDALAMFTAIAEGNRARPWNCAHALALADYGRITVMWQQQLSEIEREGPIVSGKPNARFKVMPSLSADRVRLGKILGLNVGANDAFLMGGGRNEARSRELGAAIVEAEGKRGGGLLA
jgi:hypothetical protein